jgi:hypothetical protein
MGFRMHRLGVRLWSVGLAVLGCALTLLVASSAKAQTVTVGQLFAPNLSCATFTLLQTSVSSGTSYVVPAPGVITSWSFQTDSTPVTGLKLKVGHSVGGYDYMITREATAYTVISHTVNTYPASIPVQAGDLIGIYETGGDCAAHPLSASDVVAGTGMDAPPGTTTTFGTVDHGSRLPVSARVTLQPGVSSISPPSGSTAGGTPVTITGHDFTDASAVSFGGVHAPFRINSETSITAQSPPEPPGPVDVTVTTAGGDSPATSADQFHYIPPVVVTVIAPSSGPRTGGTTVRIAGSGFTGASAVRFGNNQVARFTVDSDSLITALAPSASLGTVDVTVTAAGGQSVTSAADQFTFLQVCVVPKLKDKKLKAVTKALKGAHCKLGKVSPNGHTTGRVKRQSPKPGTILPVDTKVNIKLV